MVLLAAAIAIMLAILLIANTPGNTTPGVILVLLFMMTLPHFFICNSWRALSARILQIVYLIPLAVPFVNTVWIRCNKNGTARGATVLQFDRPTYDLPKVDNPHDATILLVNRI